MQAMQSSYDMGSWTDSVKTNSGKFAALRHVTRQMSLDSSILDSSVTPGVRRVPLAPAGVAEANAGAGVAEGAGLAHDAGNLLGALSLYSDLLAMPGVLHEEHREYASELRMLSDRSWAMIDRLVNHARSGRVRKAAEESVLLPDVVDRCKGLLSRIAGRPVEISYCVGAFQPVRVPVESVERILTNLVKNAAEATPWVGAISIDVAGVTEHAAAECGGARRRVVMTVRDRGCGMDAAAVRRLMAASGIAKSSRRGLGFRVVRELAAMSGGCLKIESQLRVGTSISVEWYGMTAGEGETRMGDGERNEAGVKMVLKEEAGWIAC
jgi:nitrogen-specific signal transduction histidine kinase